VLKQAMDIVLPQVGIVITFPLMLLTTLAIFIQDDVLVIYKQTRLTMGGNQSGTELSSSSGQ
jgi:Sugar transferases involved in lipopolysaccharide synthesis